MHNGADVPPASDEGGDPACWAHLFHDAGDGAVARGTVRRPEADPVPGEHFEQLARMTGATIELIVSGRDVEPSRYVQDHDEWVLLLAGAATLDVDGTTVDLDAGDWVLLPAYVRHDVVRVQPGTRWLAVHGTPK